MRDGRDYKCRYLLGASVKLGMEVCARVESHMPDRLFSKTHPGSVRRQLEQWVIHGVPLENLPDLEKELAKLRFTPMTERDIEAKHSIMKRKIIFKKARHTLCSLHIRSQKLRRVLKSKRALRSLMKVPG